MNKLLQERFSIHNSLYAASDSASLMTGCQNEFITHLKQVVPNVLAIYSVHRQHLIMKNLSKHLHTLLPYIIKVINKIRSNSLSDRLCGGFVVKMKQMSIVWCFTEKFVGFQNLSL